MLIHPSRLWCSLLVPCGGDSTSIDTNPTDTGGTDTGGTDTGGTDTGDTDENGPRSLIFAYGDNTTVTLGDRQAVNVVETAGSHELELTAFGRTVTFTEDDLYEEDGQVDEDVYYAVFDNGTTMNVTTLKGTWEEAHNRTHGYEYVVPYLVELFSGGANGTTELFYDVYGDETSAEICQLLTVLAAQLIMRAKCMARQ